MGRLYLFGYTTTSPRRFDQVGAQGHRVRCHVASTVPWIVKVERGANRGYQRWVERLASTKPTFG
ncbi:MAG: hypothetical protein ABL983_21155, partial [Nitrospira sp.]